MNELVLKPSYWASVSGGKDSLKMFELILHNLDKYPLDGVVHFELEIDYPFIHDVIDYMQECCDKLGIKFYRIKPRISWLELYNKYGFPTRKSRWCNSKYKLDAKKQLDDFLRTQGSYLVSYIGYCADETSRFVNRTANGVTEIYPLVENGIIESDILEWAKSQPIFNDYYKYNKRCGCMYCPMASMVNLAYLLKYYPEHYNFMMSCAKSTEIQCFDKYNKPFSVWQSNPKYNTEYIDNRVKSKWIKILDNME